jgi:hypothetical protein
MKEGASEAKRMECNMIAADGILGLTAWKAS